MLKLIIAISVLYSQLLFAQLLIKPQTARPWLGVAIGEAPNGVLIKDALPDTPAKKAGLQGGDIILMIDQEKVISPAQMIDLIGTKGVGNKVVLSIITKAGKKEKRTLELVARPDLMDLPKKALMGKTAPDFNLKVVSGAKSKTFSHSSNKKVKIIEFWGTWCGACHAAFPVVSEFAKNNPKIDVVSISNEELPKIKKYISMAIKKNYISDSIIFLQDKDSKVHQKYMIPAFPMFVVLDKHSIVQHIAVGTGQELESVFKKAKELAN